MAALSRGKYLSIIDAGISNLWSLSLPAHLESLNLHGNHIQHISNVGHLRHLVHLDLSANQIALVDNLDNLTSLKNLNLSCNMITVVEGLSSLRSLERLDLSYNQIEDVHGVSALPKLKFLSLHGNNLDNVNEVIRAVSPCHSLCHLVLAQDGSSNPLCQDPGYQSKVCRSLPGLTILNDTDISGNGMATDNALANIPGLESYLDFLLSSNDAEKPTPQASIKSPVAVLTPKIDAVMEQFKQRYGVGGESSSPSQGRTGVSSSSSEFTHHTDNTRQILSSSRRLSQKDTESSGCEDENEPVRDKVASPGSARGGRQRKQTTRARTGVTTSTTTNTTRRGRSKSKERKTRTPASAIQHTSSSLQKQQRPSTKTTTTTTSTIKPASALPLVADSSTYADDLNVYDKGDYNRHDSKNDRRKREELETGYKDVLTSLQTEKERRWKAEQAARRMADILKEVHAKHKTTDEMKTSALEATVQLKQAILNEHETNQSLNHEITKLKMELDSVRDKLFQAERDAERNREALKVAESTLAQMEGEEVVDRAHTSKKLQETNQRASAMAREAELLRHALDASKVKVENLQETLASREQQHREEMRTRYSLNSPELQEVIGSKVKEVERQQQGELTRQQHRVETLSRQYSELESEFRQALTMEEARFRELKNELDSASSENMENKQLLLAAQRKDETSTNIISELSALVKEQKGRITELARAKQEINLTHKDRVERLEETVDDMRRQVAQLDAAKQAKTKLQATVQAQESVIEGLKAERKLWGQELAQQGASLAQDRGRLESRIETFTSEIAMLKKQLEREADSVKIKTKMIEDQTETIRKLKEGVVERDNTVRETREECLATQKEAEDQVRELKAALDDSRDVIDRSSARKEELKQKVAALEAELHDSKNSHSNFSARWKEKSELIGKLEQQVTQMRNNWSQKEAKLTAERDMALDQAKDAVEKLKTADLAFRQQLDVKQAACEERLRRVEEDKRQEVELAQRKVEIVEEEMRDLLRENEANKRTMETKMKKLTQAFGDLQSGLL